ncbi:ankyrin repeat domain-containing protein [Candidatus Dependentiae bacterium]|nr:ankyrin repeat domain-containing protein [Candidatus Dependentiae bacterium]
MINKRLQVLAIGLLLLSGNCFAVLTPRFQMAAVLGGQEGLATIREMIGNVSQEDKDKALQAAALNNNFDIVQYLVLQGGADVRADGGLALTIADDHSYLDISLFLQGHGAPLTALRWYQASRQSSQQ